MSSEDRPDSARSWDSNLYGGHFTAPCLILTPMLRVAFFLALASAVAAAQAVTLYTPDTFENGTTNDWIGAPDYVTNVAGDAPGGGSRAAQIRSTGGFGAGSRLAAHNDFSRWTGNYTAANVTGVRGWFKNVGNTALNLRLVLFSGSENRTTSTVALSLPAGSGWTFHTFDARASALTGVLGLPTTSILQDVTQVMIRHDSSTPSSTGTGVVGMLLMDNIEAVPEPATMTALAVGALALLRRRK